MTFMDTQKPHSVLVTGGRGFVGRAAGKLLQRHGYRVISLDLSAPDATEDTNRFQMVSNICAFQ